MSIEQVDVGVDTPGMVELFHLVKDGTPQTRASLVTLTGLSRSTITGRVDALTSLGFLRPVGHAASTGGRPSSQFAFNPDARVALAVDLGATHCRVAVTNLGADVLASERIEIDIAEGPAHILAIVEELGTAMLTSLGRRDDLIGVGVGLPGPVEFGTGRPTTPPIMPGWDGYDVPAHLGRTFGVPILVDNDVNIMALGEHSKSWPETANLVFIKVATGVGAGIIASGMLQRGAQGTAGDLGRMRLASAVAGTSVTVEEIASGAAIAANLRERGLDVKDASMVARSARDGAADTIDALRQAGRDLGIALTNLVCLINPSVIVIGGVLADDGEDLLAGVREVVYSQSLPLATAQLQITHSKTGQDAAIIGATLLTVDHALHNGALTQRVSTRM